MKFSSKAINFGKKNGLELPTIKAYLFSRYVGSPTHWFPSEYEVLDEVPLNMIADDKVDQDWLKAWIKKWPTMSELESKGYQLRYSLSGNKPQCNRKMKRFIKEFDELTRNDGLPTPLPDKMKIIDQATDLYLEEKEADGWAYTRKNHLFIEHQDKGSLLEDYCMRIMDGEEPKAKRRVGMRI